MFASIYVFTRSASDDLSKIYVFTATEKLVNIKLILGVCLLLKPLIKYLRRVSTDETNM